MTRIPARIKTRIRRPDGKQYTNNPVLSPASDPRWNPRHPRAIASEPSMRRYLSLLVFALVVPAAADDKKDVALKPIPVARLDRKEPVGYETDVAPIFAAKCQVCHAGNLTEGKFDLGTHAALMKG